MTTEFATAETYDFVHPEHKMRMRWPLVEQIHQQLEILVADSVSERLQLPLKKNGADVQVRKFDEVLNQFGPATIVQEIELSPLSGVAWICIDKNVISSFVDRYFGGTGVVDEVNNLRKLSPTEIKIQHCINESLKNSLEKAWSSVHTLTPILRDQVSCTRLGKQHGSMIVVDVTSKYSLDEQDISLHILYPHSMLEPIGVLLNKEIRSTANTDHSFSSALRRELFNCDVELRGVMAQANMTIADLIKLKTGDFIPLRDIENVSINAKKIPLFSAQIGNRNGRVSAKFTRWHSNNNT